MLSLSRRDISALRHNSYLKLLLGCLQPQWILIWSVAIGTLWVGKLQAVTESAIAPEELENSNSPAEVTPPVTPVIELENLPLEVNSSLEDSLPKQTETLADDRAEFEKETEEQKDQSSDRSSDKPLNPKHLLLAGPNNFNPELRLQPSPPPTITPPTEPEQAETPVAVLEDLKVDFRNDSDNFGQRNRFIEPTARFRLSNGNIISFKSGFNSFRQQGIESVENIPIQLGWQGKINDVTVRLAGGVDLFNRLPTALNLDTKIDYPILPNLTLSGIAEQGPYKFNAQTLGKQITAWRYGPNLFWQIDPNTSLFSLLRFGNYNDGNNEQQSFTRLERKFGQFSLAANLFNWSYARDVERRNGYFSPPDFLVYNGELAWQGDIFDFLRCRLAATLGQQRLRGEYDLANTYQALCTAKVSPNIEADFGYTFSNVRGRETGGSTYNNNSLTGQLRVKF